MFGRKKKVEGSVSWNRDEEHPAMRCSICTGEQVAGLKNRAGGFRELMLIRNEEDLTIFRRMLGLGEEETIEKFY